MRRREKSTSPHLKALRTGSRASFREHCLFEGVGAKREGEDLVPVKLLPQIFLVFGCITAK